MPGAGHRALGAGGQAPRRMLGAGCWVPGAGWRPGAGCRVPDGVCRVLGARCRVLAWGRVLCAFAWEGLVESTELSRVSGRAHKHCGEHGVNGLAKSSGACGTLSIESHRRPMHKRDVVKSCTYLRNHKIQN